MKKIKLLVFFCLFISSSYIKLTEDDELRWKDKKIDVVDFKLTPPKISDFSAISFLSRKSSYRFSKDSIHLILYSKFIPSKSWFKKEKYSLDLLQHEQTHFDIYEAVVRKTKYKICNCAFLNNSNISDSVIRYLKLMDTELNTISNSYDKETNLSRDKIKQQAWSLEIQKELMKYSNFANDTILIVKNKIVKY